MKVNIIKKILTLLVILIISITIFTNNTYAATFNDVINSGDNFLEAGNGKGIISIEESELKGISNFVSGVLLTIAVGVTIISGIVMGMNFMFQSVEDKAKIKESMIPWVIGIFISFGAFGIWQITITIFEGL